LKGRTPKAAHCQTNRRPKEDQKCREAKFQQRWYDPVHLTVDGVRDVGDSGPGGTETPQTATRRPSGHP
jgi:hypothetical protein